eukprot:190223-Pyramimonas_sp.AAC.1
MMGNPSPDRWRLSWCVRPVWGNRSTVVTCPYLRAGLQVLQVLHSAKRSTVVTCPYLRAGFSTITTGDSTPRRGDFTPRRGDFTRSVWGYTYRLLAVISTTLYSVRDSRSLFVLCQAKPSSG